MRIVVSLSKLLFFHHHNRSRRGAKCEGCASMAAYICGSMMVDFWFLDVGSRVSCGHRHVVFMDWKRKKYIELADTAEIESTGRGCSRKRERI